MNKFKNQTHFFKKCVSNEELTFRPLGGTVAHFQRRPFDYADQVDRTARPSHHRMLIRSFISCEIKA